MMFIDSNIYLQFYDNSSNDYKKLLLAIEEIKEKIIIPDQVKDEVNRNKLSVFINSTKNKQNNLKIANSRIPEHLESNSNEEIKKWNLEISKITKDIEKKRHQLDELVESMIEGIIKNEDEASITLNKIFLNSIKANQKQLEKARQRKEFGNPPGKRSDPLGDQVSWEIVLENSSDLNNLWIITKDGDYFDYYNNKYYLNAYLLNELRSKNKKIKVHCFNKLSKGLLSFNEITKINALPTPKELNIIANEEAIVQPILSYFPSMSLMPSYSGATGMNSSGLFSNYHNFNTSNNEAFSIWPMSYNLEKCDECSVEMFPNILLMNNPSLWYSQRYRTCQSCKRKLCEECWYKSNEKYSVEIDPHNLNADLEICVQCKQNKML